MLIDSHCHLNYPDFAPDYADMLARAGNAGVGLMQTICTKMEEFPTVLAIAEANSTIYCSIGVHPHHAGEGEMVTTAELLEKSAHPKVIGLGETGLDYYYEHSPREAQRESFRRHIAASQQNGLPIIVHTRDADDDTLAILEETQNAAPFPALIHCFSSSRALAEHCLNMGIYISLSGILTFKKAEELRATAKDIPLNRILIETDAPYLAPIPYRGKRNEPAYVKEVAQCLAELRGVSAEEIGHATTENFFRLFKKATRP
ncbi:YchF/TatD family DNA exonuclease [bacterium]|nr:YchF/TatD family DNA exonuclease [bacterium]